MVRKELKIYEKWEGYNTKERVIYAVSENNV